MTAAADFLASFRDPDSGLPRSSYDLWEERHGVYAFTVGGVPGNPWFVCTLWLAKWQAATARTADDLRSAEDLLDWGSAHALPSGVVAEQVHPQTGEPLSVSPLTWSHAEFIGTVHAYLRARERLAAA